jgi:O-antigen ligase
MATVGEIGRATAPFEGVAGEANTLGAYLVLLFAIVSGIFLYSPSRKWQFCCAALACFIIPPFLFTLSRGSYLAFIFMYLTLLILTRKKRLLLIGTLILAIITLPAILPTKVTDRVKETFAYGKTYEPLAGTRITLDESASVRVETWKVVFEQWKKRPFLGYGVTGVGFIDTQYPRVFGETGIIGFLIFVWLMAAIFRYGFRIFNNIEDDWARGLTLGFLAGFIGLLIHSFSASTFIIVRIMEPFWFLAAIVMTLPENFSNRSPIEE